jgi:N-acetylglutamate synthase-like GNAT family acetyltransferase
MLRFFREELMPVAPDFHIRTATVSDIPALHELIEASVRQLQKDDYTPEQIEGAVGHTLSLDTQLIADATYFIAEATNGQPRLAGCGGWSNRKTLCGGDSAANREMSVLDPTTDAAKIRGIYVHPAWARRGLGSLILHYCESQAERAGFRHLEMGSTLTGVPLYSLKGYRECETLELPLPNGAALPVVRMVKDL